MRVEADALPTSLYTQLESELIVFKGEKLS